MTRLELAPTGIYSFEETSRRLTQFEKSAYQERDGRLVRTLCIGAKPIAVELWWTGNALAVEIGEDLSPIEMEELTKILRRMFSLDVDLTPFYHRIDGDPDLGQLVRERRGLHVVLDASPYECLIKTIVSQQLNLSFAGTLIRRLIEISGERLSHRGEELLVFPTPAQIAKLSYEDLQQLQFNRRKAEYVIDLSRNVVDGSLDLGKLESLSDDEIVKKMLPLRGVGRWTIECLLLFGMGRPDLFPAADIGLRNALRKVYGTVEQPSEEEVRRLGEAWSPWRSYAVFYLWDYLSTTKKSS
ncbi:DNA-3-methyladenine glycosylase II [Marininema mesophilum]|uniref:DNA-3-methyladenine glycosylase II n=1 Tax=Marininema mesophilum TaxID=1048340 RepID=A0A1H2WF41_9BACL|nr:DNA-3-methyladenine glycosylase [Marininema mesophilum]SDW79145.1 DNA-3-methyladenine glycosylase II [Marininema mesophilum]